MKKDNKKKNEKASGRVIALAMTTLMGKAVESAKDKDEALTAILFALVYTAAKTMEIQKAHTAVAVIDEIVSTLLSDMPKTLLVDEMLHIPENENS